MGGEGLVQGRGDWGEDSVVGGGLACSWCALELEFGRDFSLSCRLMLEMGDEVTFSFLGGAKLHPSGHHL